MPRSLRIFDVFIASPDDVAEERDRLERVIRELNETWQARLGVQLNLLRWETHAFPGFGDDAQDVINQELPETVDVFIGILWSRVGTPTTRSVSGTLEEFERAYSQWKDNPDSIKLLFYFKKAPIEVDQIEPDQIAKVRAFESSLPQMGAFYWKFSTPEDFDGIVRKHLSLLAQELADSSERGFVQEINTAEATSQVQTDDEEGLLDLIDQWTDGIDVVVSIIGGFTKSLEELGEEVRRGSDEINGLDIPNHPERTPEAKRIINSMANRLDLFSGVLLNETPVLDAAFSQALKALDKAIEIAPDFGREGIENLCSNREALQVFDEKVGGSMEAMSQMKETVENLPRVTTRFNRAKRKAVNALDGLHRSLASARTQISSSLTLVERLCRDI